MERAGQFQRSPLSLAIAVALATAHLPSLAQEAEDETARQAGKPAIERPQFSQPIEEVVVVGRLYDSARALVEERKDDEVVTNILGEEFISRTGDSTVAAALQRVSGLSLVNDQFIYVRGLGERYASTTLNGAPIPSPDLTRSVVPLDIFPTSIVESLRVQKSYSADKSAEFGGGNVDIRTIGIPDGFTYSIEVGAGVNSENDGDYLTYAGGGDDSFGTDDGTREIPNALLQGLADFQGDIDPQSILRSLRRSGDAEATIDQARLINRQLATELYRQISVKEDDTPIDYDVQGSLGSNFFLTNDLEIGFLLGGAYETDVRETTKLNRSFNFPVERTDTEEEATHSVDITGNGNVGVRYGDDHNLQLTSLWLRNTDDETAVSDFFNENRQKSDGRGFREYRITYEERELLVNQVRGTHRIGAATKELVPGDLLEWVPEDWELSWYYSESEAQTEIPNEVRVSAQTQTDPQTGAVEEVSVLLSSEAADYRFTDLDDEVNGWGWNASLPFYFGESMVEVGFGAEHNEQVRLYTQREFSLGPLSVANTDILDPPLGDVFSAANILDPANNFVFDTAGTNNQSYTAATMTDALFGKVDWTWRDTWRVSAGARWEDYRQAALDLNIFGYTLDDPIASTDPDEIARNTFQKDDIYPSVSLTYMSSWLAETFQLRFGWSETVVRPDLREITDASYIDPLTDDLVDGNPGVTPSELSNWDVRAEWFFGNGDNFTISGYYKDIDSPIEFFESAASDTTVAREIVNADSAEVLGAEVEFLKELGFLAGTLGDWTDQFFLQGNLTVQDTELKAGPEADSPTNPERELSNASPWIVNLVLGFDSFDARHSATLVYHTFDERLFVAGRAGAPDGFEQTRHLLDATWSWFPTDLLRVQAKVRNMLDATVEIEREGVTTFEEDIGRTFSLSVRWEF